MSLPSNSLISKSEGLGQLGSYTVDARQSGAMFTEDLDEDFSQPRKAPEPIPQDRYPKIKQQSLSQHNFYSKQNTSHLTNRTNVSKISVISDAINRLVEDTNRRQDAKKKVEQIKQEEVEQFSFIIKQKVSQTQIKDMINRFNSDFTRRQQNKQILEQEKLMEKLQEEEQMKSVHNKSKLSQDQAQKLTARLIEDAKKRKEQKETQQKEKEQSEQSVMQQLQKVKLTAPKSERLAKELIKDPVYERLSKDANYRTQKQKAKMKELETNIMVQSRPKINNKGRAKSVTKFSKNEAIALGERLYCQKQNNNQQLVEQSKQQKAKVNNQRESSRSKKQSSQENQTNGESRNGKLSESLAKNNLYNQSFIRPERAHTLVQKLLRQSEENLNFEHSRDLSKPESYFALSQNQTETKSSPQKQNNNHRSQNQLLLVQKVSDFCSVKFNFQQITQKPKLKQLFNNIFLAFAILNIQLWFLIKSQIPYI